MSSCVVLSTPWYIFHLILYNNITTTIAAVVRVTCNIKEHCTFEYLEVLVSNEDHQSYHDSILVIFMLYMREKMTLNNNTILKFERYTILSNNDTIFIFVLIVVNLHVKNFSNFWNYEHPKICSNLSAQSNEQHWSILMSTPCYFYLIKYHNIVVSIPKSIGTAEYLVVFESDEYY